MANTMKPPVAKAQMLVRRPVAEVFAAVVDPAITSRFWFSRGSGRLEPGARVRWDWEMYGVGTDVLVREVERERRIVLDWDLYDRPSTVEWTFEPRDDGATTFVAVRNHGFSGSDDELVARALDSTGGFAFVLAALKVFLEHGIEPNLVVDHAPDSLKPGWGTKPR